MTDHRFIDISEEALRIRVESDRLLLKRHTAEEGREDRFSFPLVDLDAVIMAHEGVTASGMALAALAKAGCGVVVCDAKRLPVGMLLPLTGNSTQAERFRAQAGASVPLRKQIWKMIVRAKIRNQGELLQELTGDDGGLFAMAAAVKSGDSDNREAQAAQRYWKRIFPHRKKPFTRDRDAVDENMFLNYGYSVLRASTARALCAAGLHTGLGVYHHNRYDAYCLADDVMEPFRPLVDGVVASWWAMRDDDTGPPRLDAAFKQTLICELGSSLHIGDERRTLFDILGHVASSLAQLFMGKRKDLHLPYLRSPLLAACPGRDKYDAERLGE